MTNAEKLALDTEVMARVLAMSKFCAHNCDDCLFYARDDKYEWCAKAQRIKEISQWLESEVEENDFST